jgi:hypothetical protein
VNPAIAAALKKAGLKSIIVPSVEEQIRVMRMYHPAGGSGMHPAGKEAPPIQLTAKQKKQQAETKRMINKPISRG